MFIEPHTPSLFKLLNRLGVIINDQFCEDSPLGFHTGDVERINDYALERGLFVNRLAADKIIVAEQEVRLGKSSIIVQRSGNVIRYHSVADWGQIKSAYSDISHLDAVPTMAFPSEAVVVQEYIDGDILHCASVSSWHRAWLIGFLTGMNSVGYAHRDLHCKNIVVNEKSLHVVDWDFVARQRCPLEFSYDLTGRGMVSPHLTWNTNIFKSWPNLGVRSVADILDINIKDLIDAK